MFFSGVYSNYYIKVCVMLQAGFVSAPHLGTPLDTVEPSAFARAYKGSYADRVYRQFQDTDDTYSEREAAFPRFRTTLLGPTYTSPPTGGFSSPVSIVMGQEPSEAMVRQDFTSFLQPGGPPKVEVHGADGPQWTSDGPGSQTVYRTPTGKQRNVRGAMTIERAEQEAARSRHRILAQREAMFASDEVAIARALALRQQQQEASAELAALTGTPPPNNAPASPDVSQHKDSVYPAVQVQHPALPGVWIPASQAAMLEQTQRSATLPASTPSTPASTLAVPLTPSQLAGAVPHSQYDGSDSNAGDSTSAGRHFQHFLHGLRNAMNGTMNSSDRSAWAAENIVYFVVCGLLVLVLILCIVFMCIFMKKGRGTTQSQSQTRSRLASGAFGGVQAPVLPPASSSPPVQMGGRITTLRPLASSAAQQA